MITYTVHYRNGLNVEGQLLRIFHSLGKRLFFTQDRIVLTDDDNNVMDYIDLMEFVTGDASDTHSRHP